MLKNSSLLSAGKIVIALAMSVVAIEIILRALLNFPLYDADSTVGYWVKPNQRGTYLLDHDWAFNSNSMGVSEEFRPSRNFDLLIVGDSLVLGGNPLRQADKLGPIVARNTGWSVWPVSAGSWAMQNELAFLNRNRSIVERVDAIIFVVNSGDFAKPSSWASQITHPRTYPRSFVWYLFEKCCYSSNVIAPKGLLVPDQDVLGAWKAFNKVSSVPVIVIAYPALNEVNKCCSWVPTKFATTGRWFCYHQPQSGFAEYYRDDVHPNVAGDFRLAKFVQAAVLTALRDIRRERLIMGISTHRVSSQASRRLTAIPKSFRGEFESTSLPKNS